MNKFVFRSIDDVSSHVSVWEEILEKLPNSDDDLIGEEDIWEEARLSDDLPHFGNIYQYLLLSQIKYLTEKQYPNSVVEFDVNSIASQLYLDGDRVYDAANFFEYLENEENDD